jgi:lipoprotein-anchoring transpeptidase ErfK/SrfK
MKENLSSASSSKRVAKVRKLSKKFIKKKHLVGEGLVERTSVWHRLSKYFDFSKSFKAQNPNPKKVMALSILSFLVVIFFGGLLFSNLYYKNKILPGTKVGSLTLNQDPQEASQQLSKSIDQFKFRLNFKDQQTEYTPTELGLTPDLNSTIEEAKNLNHQTRFFKKPFAIFSKRNLNLSSNLDQKVLQDFLTANNYAQQIPADAKIEFNQGSANFEIIPEVSGRGVDIEAFSKDLAQAYSKISPEEVNLDITDTKPSIKAVSLTDLTSRANSIIHQKIVINTPLKAYSPSLAQKKDWLSLTPQPESGSYLLSINTDAQKKYLDSTVKSVQRSPEARVVASIGSQEFVVQPGASGYRPEDYTSVLESLNKIFPGAAGAELTLKFKEIAPPTQNITASDGRWIFADLSEYKIYAYQGSSLVNSFLISSGARATPTPTGSYSISRKVRVKTMSSGGNPKSPDYYSVPNIEWVAYFKSGGYAMHGVYWHNKFGKQNTSHGCMGMSNSNAQWVYDFIDIGTPVVVVQ